MHAAETAVFGPQDRVVQHAEADVQWKEYRSLPTSLSYWAKSGITSLWILCSISHQCRDLGRHAGQYLIVTAVADHPKGNIRSQDKREKPAWLEDHPSGW